MHTTGFFPVNSCFKPSTTWKKGHSLAAMSSALLCYFQSKVLVLDISVQVNGVPNLLLFLFYIAIFYVVIIFWCSHWWHLRWEWTWLLSFQRHLFSDLWGSGKQGLAFPHLPCRWAGSLSKCRLTPCRQVSHCRVETSTWRVASVGCPHRCGHVCSSNVIPHCAEACFNLCFQMVLSCYHVSSK